MRRLITLLVAVVATFGVAQGGLYNAHNFMVGMMSDFAEPYDIVDCPYLLPEDGITQACLVIDHTPMFMRLAVDVTMSGFTDIWPAGEWLDDYDYRVHNRAYGFQPSVGSMRIYIIGVAPDGVGSIVWVVEYPYQ